MGQVSFRTNAFQNASPMFQGNVNIPARKTGLVRFGDGTALGAAPAQPASASADDESFLQKAFHFGTKIAIALGISAFYSWAEIPGVIGTMLIPPLLLTFLNPKVGPDGHLTDESKKKIADRSVMIAMLPLFPLRFVPLKPVRKFLNRVEAGIRQRGKLLYENNELTRKYLEEGGSKGLIGKFAYTLEHITWPLAFYMIAPLVKEGSFIAKFAVGDALKAGMLEPVVAPLRSVAGVLVRVGGLLKVGKPGAKTLLQGGLPIAGADAKAAARAELMAGLQTSSFGQYASRFLGPLVGGDIENEFEQAFKILVKGKPYDKRKSEPLVSPFGATQGASASTTGAAPAAQPDAPEADPSLTPAT